MSKRLSGLKQYVIPAVIVLAAMVLSAVLLLVQLFTTAYAVTVDGDLWGYVNDPEEVDDAVAAVNDRAAEALGYGYELSADISCEEVVISSDEEIGCDGMEEKLFDEYVPEVETSYALKVDGELIGIGDKDELEQAVDDAVSEFVTEDTTDVEILSDIEVVYEDVPADTDKDSDAIISTLTEPVSDTVIYTAHDGDTVEAIAEENDMTAEEIAAMNPDIEIEKNTEGDGSVQTGGVEGTPVEDGAEVVIAPKQTLISVKTVKTEVRFEDIPFDVEEVEDEDMFVGETEVRTEGETGTMGIYEEVTCMNGDEVDRQVTDQIVSVEPINKVVAIGTKVWHDNVELSAGTDSVSVYGDDRYVGEVSQNEEEPEEGVVTTTTTTTTTTVPSAGQSGTTQQSGTQQTAQSSQSSFSDAYQQEETQQETAAAVTSSFSSLGAQIAAYAQNFVGCAYVHGGHGPNVFDCSGLTSYVYRHFGYELPWTVTGQYAMGTYVPLDVSQMQPGDLIFWSYGGSTPTHVGMYIGNGQYIQATKPGDVVRINTVSSYPGQPLVGCRRIIN